MSREFIVKPPWKLLKPHSAGCHVIAHMRGHARKHSFSTPWWLERAHAIDNTCRGRTGDVTKRMGNYRWLRFKCRAFNCDGLFIVREDHVLALLMQAGGPGPFTGAPEPKRKP